MTINHAAWFADAEIKSKSRIILSIGLAGLVFLLLPASLHREIHLLAAWDTEVICFLTLLGFTIVDATPKRTLDLTRQREPNTLIVLIIVVITACYQHFCDWVYAYR